MPAVRVLVVDDSALVRKLVSDALAEVDGIEVVGVAANGKLALQKLTQCNPDVITLDVEMPELDGLGTLAALRKTHPKLPVIMLSSLTEQGGKITLDALSRGASDYVTKPNQSGGGADAAKTLLREDLAPKILALAKRVQLATPRPMPAALPVDVPRSATVPRAVIVAISTGGPNALAEFIPALPKDFPLPILIVQHMPPMFTKLLAERLDQKSGLTVCEAQAGMQVTAGTVYIAPGDFHMTVERGASGALIALNQMAPENGCRPAADVLFRSAVKVYGGDLLAVVMTGMGRDGKRGCELVRERNGTIIIQDQATSVVWGMPGAVSEAGLADATRPLHTLAREVVLRATRES